MPGLDDVEIGLELDPYEYRITYGTVLKYVEAVEDDNPWYGNPSTYREPIAPPTICDLAVLEMPQIPELHAKVGGMYHAAIDYEFLNPARIGKKVTVKAKVADRYVKRDRQYLEIDGLIVDEDGRDIMRQRFRFASFKKMTGE